MKKVVPNDLSVGKFAARAGVPVSTLHYYEAEGLIQSWRNGANHRRYDRRELRRVAVIKVAQSVGLTLAEIRAALADIPHDRSVDKSAWEGVSETWRARLDAEIAVMQALRDQLGSCIGCGCLSLQSCPLYNPNDVMAEEGAGPRRTLTRENP